MDNLVIGSREWKIVESNKGSSFPPFIRLLYSAFTYYLGFKVNSGEYKVMGLAPYGEPRYVDLIQENLISVKDDGSFQLDMSYFDYPTGLTMTSKKFHKLFGGPPRSPETQLTQLEMDLAASVQKVTEDIVLKIAKEAQERLEKTLFGRRVALTALSTVFFRKKTLIIFGFNQQRRCRRCIRRRTLRLAFVQ